MSILNAATLIGTQKTFRTLFLQSFDSVSPNYQKHVMEMGSTNAAEIYQWLGRVGAMQEWLDTKNIDELRGFDFTIKNKDWESTIGVDRNSIEDDQLGMYGPRIADLGVRARQHPNKLLSDARKAGVTTLGYDGQFFYDTDHSEGDSGTQSNKLTGTGTTVAQIRTDIFAAKSQFRKFKDDKGEPFVEEAGNQDFLATIHPDFEVKFEELNNPGPGSTIPKTVIPYEVDPRLTDVNDFYLDYIGLPLRPFIKQNRKAVDFVSLDDPNASETVFMRKKFFYGVEGRYNVSYGLYQLSMLTTNT